MMCCCRSQIASDYMKFSFNPLCLVYVPAPSPPPPLRQLRPSFSYPALSLPVSTLTRGIQGCPKTISLDKNIWHSSFLKIFPNLLFSAALHPYIFATPSAEKCSPFSTTQQPENLSGFFFHHSFFHPCLTNANYLCRRIFRTSLFNPSRRASGFTREGGRRGGQITSALP